MWKQSDPRWLWVFGPVTLLIVGLLLIFHRASVEVPMVDGVDYVTAEGLHVCTPQPGDWNRLWTDVALDVAIGTATELEIETRITEGPCLTCTEGPCLPGRIVVSLQDQEFNPDHVGEFRGHVVDGVLERGVILLPSHVMTDEGRISVDKRRLILAHEYICHGTGRGHARAVVGPNRRKLPAVPSGHLCAPTTEKLGAITEGL